jgi:hypothetical protein
MTAAAFTHHASKRIDEREFDPDEVAEVIGDVDRPATAPDASPSPGRPVRIGLQASAHPGDRRHVLLGVTRGGRFGIAVVAYAPNGSRAVVTIFDPALEPQLWRSDFTGPSRTGVRAMPPTMWCRPPGK